MDWWVEKLSAVTSLNQPWEWLAAFVLGLIVYVAAALVRRWVRTRYRHLAEAR